jgi:hypothetical protein
MDDDRGAYEGKGKGDPEQTLPRRRKVSKEQIQREFAELNQMIDNQNRATRAARELMKLREQNDAAGARIREQLKDQQTKSAFGKRYVMELSDFDQQKVRAALEEHFKMTAPDRLTFTDNGLSYRLNVEESMPNRDGSGYWIYDLSDNSPRAPKNVDEMREMADTSIEVSLDMLMNPFDAGLADYEWDAVKLGMDSRLSDLEDVIDWPAVLTARSLSEARMAVREYFRKKKGGTTDERVKRSLAAQRTKSFKELESLAKKEGWSEKELARLADERFGRQTRMTFANMANEPYPEELYEEGMAPWEQDSTYSTMGTTNDGSSAEIENRIKGKIEDWLDDEIRSYKEYVEAMDGNQLIEDQSIDEGRNELAQSLLNQTRWTCPSSIHNLAENQYKGKGGNDSKSSQQSLGNAEKRRPYRRFK